MAPSSVIPAERTAEFSCVSEVVLLSGYSRKLKLLFVFAWGSNIVFVNDEKWLAFCPLHANKPG